MAKIYFKHLSITNFMSYEHADLDLNRSGNVLVGGINNNPEDNAKSNGCGKSSLFSALSWCLTGETISGAKDVSNIYTDGKTEVSLTFEIDNDSYKIVRTKNPSNLFIYINNENKSGKGIRDTSELLTKYIPQLSSSLINSVIILGQGLPQRFTNNSPSGRKEILEKLSNSDFMITDLKTRLSDRKLNLQDKQRILQDDNLTKETSIKINKETIESLTAELNTLESKEELVSKLNRVESELLDTVNKIKDLDEFTEILQENLSEANKEYGTINDDYNNALSEVEQIDTSIEENDLLNLKSECKSLSNEILKLENVTDICPTCGQKLPNVQKFDTSKLHDELDNKSILVAELENKITNIKEKNTANIEACKRLFDEKIKIIKEDIDILNEDISTNQNKLNGLNDLKYDKEKIKIDLENKINALETNIKYRQDKISELTKTNSELQNQLNSNADQLSIVEERLAINSKMQTLVKRDFRGFLLNNVIFFIESKAKEYSSLVFGTDKLSFKLNNNNIDISYDNKDYSVLSGGEKQKLDIIIQFAIRDMLCTFLDFSSNILILDEITDSLDSIGVSNIFDLINSSLNDVEVTYIISHHIDELEIPADDEITIIKGIDKISRIV